MKVNSFPHLMKLSSLRLVLVAWLLFGGGFFVGNNIPLLIPILFLSGFFGVLSLLNLSKKESAAYCVLACTLAVLLMALDVLLLYICFTGGLDL
jgi:hypothetical protein